MARKFKEGSNSGSPKTSRAFLAGERAASGIMSAQAARALDASHRDALHRASHRDEPESRVEA